MIQWKMSFQTINQLLSTSPLLKKPHGSWFLGCPREILRGRTGMCYVYSVVTAHYSSAPPRFYCMQLK